MTDKPKPDPAESARQARKEREAAALRANLLRRKAQARALAGRDAAPPPSPPDDASDTTPDAAPDTTPNTEAG